MQHGGGEVAGSVEVQQVAGAQAPRIAGQRVPGTVGARPIERDADPGLLDARLGVTFGRAVLRLRTGRAHPAGRELRRYHPCVVRHQHVARPQQLGQVAHDPVGHAVTRNMQQARGVARPGRMLGDAVRR